MQPGGTKYSLIPEEEEEKEEAKEEGIEKPDPTKNSSRKRKKVWLACFYHIIEDNKIQRLCVSILEAVKNEKSKLS